MKHCCAILFRLTPAVRVKWCLGTPLWPHEPQSLDIASGSVTHPPDPEAKRVRT